MTMTGNGTIAPPRPSFTLVVPMYNEEERFAERADELADYIEEFPPGSRLVLVDDGSDDRTVAAVESFMARRPTAPVTLLRRTHEGKGAAVRAGLETATGDYAGFCDVDLSTPLDQLDVILRAAVMSRVLAIGSRDVMASRLVRPQSRFRESLGKAYNRLVQLSLTPGISDTQCGAKVASTIVWKAVLPHCRQVGFAWDVEAITVARRLGIVVREVAIAWSHDDRTRVRLGRDGAAMVAAVPTIMRDTRRVPEEERFEPEAGGVFDEQLASTLIESDTDHWWFRSKGAIVGHVLRRQLRLAEPPLLVDVGAGAGGVTAMLGWPPDDVVAVDGSEVLAATARDRHALPAAVGEIGHLPLPPGRVGVIAMLDVIEHLDDPDAALRDAWGALHAGGLLVITVPAHQWLWSGADELLGHVRRYTRPLLRGQLAAAGFEPVLLSHIFSWLVPPVWLQRRLATSAHQQLGLDQRSALLDRVALVLTRLEQAVVRRVSLPLGTSILCVARKADRPGAGA